MRPPAARLRMTRGRSRRRANPAVLPLLAGVVLGLCTACGSGSTATARVDARGGPAGAAAVATAEATTSPATIEPSGPRPLPAGNVRPTRLEVPRIGISAPLDALELQPDGELEKPPAWNRPGWYADGAVPGQPGPAVIAGHVDSPDGPAVFWRLRDLRKGDRVSVRLSDRSTVAYTVTRIEEWPKNRFPSADVYGPTPDQQLRLITCAGVYDKGAGGYRDNRIVFAEAV